MDPLYIRGAERILIVLIGGLAVCLGYRLFLHLPDKADSQGKIILPGNISIFFSRVGPGVFFVLFGASIVIASLYFSLTTQQAPQQEGAAQQGQHPAAVTPQFTAYSYMGGNQAELAEQRANIRGWIFSLNRLPHFLKEDLEPSKRQEMIRDMEAIKLSLMATVWQENGKWGDYQQFRLWVLAGKPLPVPTQFAAAAAFFQQGLEGGTP